MVTVAGGKVLASSYDVKPQGYFSHGLYPFVVTPLYTIKGSPLGLGIVDMFKSAQQHSDKIDQIILKNAYSAAHKRIIYMDESVDPEELADFSKEMIKANMPPATAITWMPQKPLPSHILAYRTASKAPSKRKAARTTSPEETLAQALPLHLRLPHCRKCPRSAAVWRRAVFSTGSSRAYA
jgi:hypothetical protein